MKLGLFKHRWKLGLAALGVLIATGFGARHYLQREQAEGAFELRVTPPSTQEELALALYQSLGVRLLAGHTVRLLPNGSVFDALIEQIGAAKTSIHVLMYIWEQGAASERVVKAIVARAQAGVRCRIVIDDVGSPEFAETVQPALVAAGCQVRVFRPLAGDEKLARNHRKLFVIDGASATTGGFGVRDNWLGDGVRGGSWRDTNVLFTGPAVSDAQQAFAENWQEVGGALLPAEAFPASDGVGTVRAAFVGSTQGVVTRAERLTQLMIATAQRRLWIANAYFVPSRGIIELLSKKARAGVDVRILAPDKNSDSKTAFGAQHIEFDDLLESGAQIWEYSASMMHAKTMVIDDSLAVVGSINLDPLSLRELEEGALVVHDSAFNDQLSRAFSADCARSKSLSR